MPVEWSLIMLNGLGAFFFFVHSIDSFKTYLKIDKKQKLFIFSGVATLLLTFRGIHNIIYELTASSMGITANDNLSYIVTAIILLVASYIFAKQKNMLKSKSSNIKKKKTQEFEKIDESKIKENLAIIEEAHENGIIDDDTYKKDKAEMHAMMHKNKSKKKTDEMFKKMDNLIGELEKLDE